MSARRLHEAFQTGMTSEIVSHTLNHLLIYCQTHLEDEEDHMRALSYPGLKAQVEEHRDLMTRVYHLRDEHLEGVKSVPLDLSLLVVTWFRRHIVEYDQQFADFIRSKNDEPASQTDS